MKKLIESLKGRPCCGAKLTHDVHKDHRDVVFDTLREFAGDALESVFQELLDGPGFEPDRWRGAGFCIHKPLPPAHLIGHYHPVIKRDPFRGWN